MEIYVAISDFTPPVVDGSQNILKFAKGDTFEIFDCHKTDADWWGARCLKSNVVGYVPSRYMQYEEKRIGKLLPNNYKSDKESSLKRLSDIQNSPNHIAPEEVIPQTPVPDYGEAVTPENQNVFNFARKFQNVLTSIQKIDNMYSENDEPAPDYLDDVDADLPPPPDDLHKDRSPSVGSMGSDDGLIQPRKLPNPCLESNTRIALHKELLHNYKHGKNVLEKPELTKALQNRRETQRRKEWDDAMSASHKRTSFELKLEQQATKLQSMEEEMKPIQEEKDQPEYKKVFNKIKSKNNSEKK